jgi:hypothetical protein
LGALARALLSEKKTQEADDTIQQALRLVERSRNRLSIFEVGLAAARVEAATGKRDAAATRLRTLQSDAKGYAGVGLDVDLGLGELEIASGRTAEGRARLAAVEQQARAKGFLLTAGQAAAARR